MEQKMIRGKATPSIMMMLVSVLFLFSSFATHATLLNSDFSQGADGLDNWMGYVEIDDFNVGIIDDSGDITASYPVNYSVLNNVLTLGVSEGQDQITYIVEIFQVFTLQSLLAGQTLEMAVNLLASSLDVSLGDYFYAGIYDVAGTNLLADLRTGIADLTALAGQEVSIRFGVDDVDGDLESKLDVSNIRFNVVDPSTASSVPEPSSLLLLALGVFLVRRKQL